MSNSEKTFYNLTEVSEILVESVKAMKSLNERLEFIEKQIGIKEKKLDKFAELKEAHRKGAVIQYKNWTTKYFLDCPDNIPKWNESTEYRIKPKQPTLEQDIQQLKDKYKQYKFTITIEDNI